ncbi:MAG TPA: Na+/H+ antiporter [Mycobacteriales bacterium]|nr:Na+/H+ antiporter [Mycobacteriales bacterium]
MHGLEGGLGVVLLVASAAIVAGVARKLSWSAPLLCVLVGLAASMLPGIPEDRIRIAPDVVLSLVLPPLLFSAALDSSFVNFRKNLRPIGLLSVGLVLFTALSVGVVMAAVVPDMHFVVACTLGAIVAPPDAVAATAIARKLGLPRRMVVILAGESLVNDATALTAYRVAVAATMGTGYSFADAAGVFLLAAAGGVAIGLVVATAVNWLTRRLRDAVLENTLILLAPFLAYVPAESLHASGVLAVVVAGLSIGHHAPRTATYAGRLQASAIWKMVDFLLESSVFLLIGLQLRAVAREGTVGVSVGELATWVSVAVLVVIATRFIWVFPATLVPRLLSRRLRERDPAPHWRFMVVESWAGMRGVVSIAAAYALPVSFPERNLIIFLTFGVVISTLVLHGFTLPWLIRRLGVVADSERKADDLAEAAAQHAAIGTSLSRLDEMLAAAGPEVPEEVVARLRERAELRSFGAWERLGGGADTSTPEPPTATYRRLRREMLETERQVFVELRDAGRIDDEVMRRVQRELDLEEAMIARD